MKAGSLNCFGRLPGVTDFLKNLNSFRQSVTHGKYQGRICELVYGYVISMRCELDSTGQSEIFNFYHASGLTQVVLQERKRLFGHFLSY